MDGTTVQRLTPVAMDAALVTITEGQRQPCHTTPHRHRGTGNSLSYSQKKCTTKESPETYLVVRPSHAYLKLPPAIDVETVEDAREMLNRWEAWNNRLQEQLEADRMLSPSGGASGLGTNTSTSLSCRPPPNHAAVKVHISLSDHVTESPSNLRSEPINKKDNQSESDELQPAPGTATRVSRALNLAYSTTAATMQRRVQPMSTRRSRALLLKRALELEGKSLGRAGIHLDDSNGRTPVFDVGRDLEEKLVSGLEKGSESGGNDGDGLLSDTRTLHPDDKPLVDLVTDVEKADDHNPLAVVDRLRQRLQREEWSASADSRVQSQMSIIDAGERSLLWPKPPLHSCIQPSLSATVSTDELPQNCLEPVSDVLEEAEQSRQSPFEDDNKNEDDDDGDDDDNLLDCHKSQNISEDEEKIGDRTLDVVRDFFADEYTARVDIIVEEAAGLFEILQVRHKRALSIVEGRRVCLTTDSTRVNTINAAVQWFGSHPVPTRFGVVRSEQWRKIPACRHAYRLRVRGRRRNCREEKTKPRQLEDDGVEKREMEESLNASQVEVSKLKQHLEERDAELEAIKLKLQVTEKKFQERNRALQNAARENEAELLAQVHVLEKKVAKGCSALDEAQERAADQLRRAEAEAIAGERARHAKLHAEALVSSQRELCALKLASTLERALLLAHSDKEEHFAKAQLLSLELKDAEARLDRVRAQVATAMEIVGWCALSSLAMRFFAHWARRCREAQCRRMERMRRDNIERRRELKLWRDHVCRADTALSARQGARRTVSSSTAMNAISLERGISAVAGVGSLSLDPVESPTVHGAKLLLAKERQRTKELLEERNALRCALQNSTVENERLLSQLDTAFKDGVSPLTN